MNQINRSRLFEGDVTRKGLGEFFKVRLHHYISSEVVSFHSNDETFTILSVNSC